MDARALVDELRRIVAEYSYLIALAPEMNDEEAEETLKRAQSLHKRVVEIEQTLDRGDEQGFILL